jgi:hypothetical protein
MMTDPDPKKKKTGTDTEETPVNNESQYIEPEAIDSQEPEDLDSDDENI